MNDVLDSGGFAPGYISPKEKSDGKKNIPEGYVRCNEETISSVSPKTGNNNNIKPWNEVWLCKTLLQDIMKDPNAKAFLCPVDWKGLNLESYPKVIKRQMDLHTALSKLEKGYYKSSDKIDQDVSLYLVQYDDF